MHVRNTPLYRKILGADKVPCCAIADDSMTRVGFSDDEAVRHVSPVRPQHAHSCCTQHLPMAPCAAIQRDVYHHCVCLLGGCY